MNEIFEQDEMESNRQSVQGEIRVNWSWEPLSIIENRHRVRHHNEAGNLKTSSHDSLVHWLNIEWSWKDDSGRKGWMSPPWVRVLGVIRNAGVLSGCACERGLLRVYGSQAQLLRLSIIKWLNWTDADTGDRVGLGPCPNNISLSRGDGVLGEAGEIFQPEFASFWKSEVSAPKSYV